MDVDTVVQQLKSLKIQGAVNSAKAALKAYANSNNRKAAAKKLIAAQPTEPMVKNVLKLAEHQSPEQILSKISSDQSNIILFGTKKLGRCSSIYTHCHSSTVMKIIKAVKPSVVYNTETRPMYQGRMTAKELASFGIKVVHSVDSLMASQIEKSDVVLLGADAITEKGFYNKIGSATVCFLAKACGKPIYICAHSLKFSKAGLAIEQRGPSEVWDKPPRGVAVLNPAFEFVPKEFVGGIVCEKGVLSFEKFLNKVNARKI